MDVETETLSFNLTKQAIYDLRSEAKRRNLNLSNLVDTLIRKGLAEGVHLPPAGRNVQATDQ